VLALDIGATKLAVGLVDADGRVIAQARRPTPRVAREAIDCLLDMGRQMMTRAAGEGLRLAGTGIACGGPLDLERGLVLSPPNLPGWDEVPIADLARQVSGLPVSLQNDAAAGALATCFWDNPAGDRDVAYITVSSGIGCGVVSDGRLYAGSSGNGTELGHIPLIWGGRACRCGLSGCAEAYLSGTSIGERFGEATGRGPFTAEQVAQLAAGGDAEAQAFWMDTMLMLRRLARAAADLFDPALLVLGGGVTDAPPQLLAPVFDTAGQAASMVGDVGKAMVLRRTGFGRNSGVLSAAAVAWNDLVPNGRERIGVRAWS
jgi:glucokinase